MLSVKYFLLLVAVTALTTGAFTRVGPHAAAPLRWSKLSPVRNLVGFNRGPAHTVRMAAADGSSTEEQEITDLNLEEMFEVFEAADSEISNEDAGMDPAAPASAVAETDGEDDDQFKQLRVVFYIVISLIPILFLLPFLSDRPPVPLDPEFLQQMAEQQ